jgi:predicted ATPase/DNA-binding SARP family transcriptional activator
VLGPIEGWVGARQVPLRGPRQVGLFALLALNANRAVLSDVIIETLWGPARGGAGKSLQMTVARLRKALAEAGLDAEPTLRTVGHGYLLTIASEQLDCERFAALTATGQDALEANDPARARELLSEALGLWRGPPLTEVAFDDFAQAEIRRLEELRLLATETRVEADLMLGHHAELIGELSSLLVAHPGRERVAGQLMVALYRCGRQNDALDVYQRVRMHLLDEVGLDPGPGLQQLQAQVLDQDPVLAAPVSPALPGPARLSSDGDGGAGPNLPIASSSLIGRAKDIEEVSELISGQARLVTLTGSGGVGKTRLATEVAHNIGSGWRDGARFVELAPLADPGLVAATVVTAVGLRTEPGTDASEVLARELADRERLLVLDNCEHVVATVATIVELLLDRCPGVSVLATSREPLQLEQELLYRVPSLSIPPIDDHRLPPEQRLRQLGAAESVQLLTVRARARRPDFELTADNIASVVTVCRHLDGIPLAIELAASRLRSISIDDLCARLDQQYGLLSDRSRRRAPRHQTLTALLDWSYELLPSAEQRLLSRLAVFAGGFVLNAVEQICATDDAQRFELADQLSALVDKSLVQVDGRPGAFRYRMLEPIREYAQTKLSVVGANEATRLQTAHRDHYLALAETVIANFETVDKRAKLDRLDAELDNLRAAERYSQGDPDPEPGLRLVVAMARFSWDRGYLAESLQALKTHLDRPDSAAPTRIRGEALRSAALAASIAGSIDQAVAFVTEALEIGRALDDSELTAQALHELGNLRYLQGDLDASLQALTEALALVRKLDDPRRTANVLMTRGVTLRERGVDAGPSFSEARELYRVEDNITGGAAALSCIGELDEQNGDLPSARTHLQEALDILRELDIPAGIAVISTSLARVAHRLGDNASARTLALDATQRAYALRLSYPLAYALQSLALGTASINPTLAASLHGAADQLAAEIGLRFPYLEAQARAAALIQLRDQLGETEFQAAHKQGQHQPKQDLIANAALTAMKVDSAESPALATTTSQVVPTSAQPPFSGGARAARRGPARGGDRSASDGRHRP